MRGFEPVRELGCHAVRGKPVAKWCFHYPGISWALETSEFRVSLKDSYFATGWLPHLPSAIIGGFPYRKEGVQSATIQGSSQFGNGPTQPLVARNPVNCGDVEEYSGEVTLCTYLALVTFFLTTVRDGM